MNASATGPSAPNSFSAAVLGRTARWGRVRPRAAVMLIAHRRLTRRDQHVLGHDLPVAATTAGSRPSSTRTATSVPIRVTGPE
jgi:hypothetical protein